MTQLYIFCKSFSPLLYNGLINIYKKEFSQFFESKDKGWKQKYDYKNLNNLEYQPDQSLQQQQPVQAKQLDRELPLWIEPGDRFHALGNRILNVTDNELKTSASDNRYNFNGMRKLIKDITDNKMQIMILLTRSKK